jgi:coenzyme F420-0:L-glutamate ligase/coenzyme F420-1:gamma-L-glutamate ligase
MPEFLEVLKTRRSIRRYQAQIPSKKTLLEILDLARYCANAHNSQPYRFVVILNFNLKEKLIKAIISKYEQDLRKDGFPEVKVKKTIENAISNYLHSPVLILACITLDEMHKYLDPERQHCELLMATQSCANSLQNLLLIAHAKKLGACWYCAPLFCAEIIKLILNLPPSYIPQAFITLGTPNETPAPIDRKPLDEIVQFLE